MKIRDKIVRVTLCAPSDVSREVELLANEIHDWNSVNWESRHCGIKVRHWLTDAVPDMTERGQGVINRQLIDDTDLIVAVFWSRMGTPTGMADSGTAEEVLRAIAQNKRAFLYFSKIEPQTLKTLN
jgi:hypothetical protein